MSYDARQRYRRQKADRFRGAQLAPSHPMPPVRCEECSHARLMHNGQCLLYGCECTEYREATT